jgi:hypothetical protein
MSTLDLTQRIRAEPLQPRSTPRNALKLNRLTIKWLRSAYSGLPLPAATDYAGASPFRPEPGKMRGVVPEGMQSQPAIDSAVPPDLIYSNPIFLEVAG